MSVDRRSVLLGLVAGGLVLPRGARGGRVEAEAALARLIGGAVLRPGKVAVVLPALVEDGSSVPLSLAVTDTDSPVVALHLIAPANPEPVIASVRLFPGARPELRTRIRLAASQSVRAVALLADGSAWEGDQAVSVTVGGCIGGPPVGEGGTPVPRIRLPDEVRAAEPVEIRTLIEHPMETGRRRGADGVLVPRRILDRFTLALDGRPLIEAELGPGIAANPLIVVSILGQPGGTLDLSWCEEGGQRLTASRRLAGG